MRNSPTPQVKVDLWGRKGTFLRDRRGRPSYAKTPENRDLVENRAAAGWSVKNIARELGCHEDTVRRNFAAELQLGFLRIEGEMLDALRIKARQGHAPSIRLLRDILAEKAPTAPRRPAADDNATPPEKELPLGKKEQRLRDAAATPDDWGDIEDEMQAGLRGLGTDNPQ